MHVLHVFDAKDEVVTVDAVVNTPHRHAQSTKQPCVRWLTTHVYRQVLLQRGGVRCCGGCVCAVLCLDQNTPCISPVNVKTCTSVRIRLAISMTVSL